MASAELPLHTRIRKLLGFENRKETVHLQGTSSECRVFICYRRTDGILYARKLVEILKNRTVQMAGSGQVPLQMFLDLNLVGVANWKDHHRPALEIADAFVLLITPAIAADVSTDKEPDWVHQELRWWLSHRPNISPILLDTTGEGTRWLPRFVRDRWKEINRIPFKLSELDDLPGEAEKAAWCESVAEAVIVGIRDRAGLIQYEEVERLYGLHED